MIFRQSRLDSEKGAIMVVFAIVIFALGFFAMFGINTATLSTARSHHKQIANLVALSAINEFVAQEGAVSVRLSAAKTKAQSIITANLASGISYTVNSHCGTTPTDSDNTVNLEVGHYFFQDPQTGSSHCTGGYPCFEKVNPVNCASDTFRPNAIRATINSSVEGSSLFLMSGLGGPDNIKLKVDAVATTTPRDIVVLVDLSRQMTRDTHRLDTTKVNNDLVTVEPSEYAFKFLPGVNCPFTGSAQLIAKDKIKYDKLPVARPNIPVDVGMVYQSDYQCVDVNVGGSNVSYLVDVYTEPQPLESALAGVRKLIDELDNVTREDRISIYGFDESSADRFASDDIRDLRTVSLSLPNKSSGAVGELYDAVDTSNWIHSSNNRKDRHFFPREHEFVDLTSALNHAYTELQARGRARSSKHVILITSGMSICQLNAGSVNCVDPTASASIETDIANAISNSVSYLDVFDTDNIAFHLVLAGNTDGAHTLIQASSGGVCMNDYAVRDAGGAFVDGTSATDADMSNIFSPARLQAKSVSTRGIYGALRPCCRLTTHAHPEDPLCECATQAELRSVFQNTCATNSGSMNQLNASAGSFHALNFDFPSDTSLRDYKQLDDSGRLLCDPFGRSKCEQMVNSYIDAIVKIRETQVSQ